MYYYRNYKYYYSCKTGSYLLLFSSFITLAIIPIIVPGIILFINISIVFAYLVKYINDKNVTDNEIILFFKFDNVPINAKGIGINNNNKLNWDIFKLTNINIIAKMTISNTLIVLNLYSIQITPYCLCVLPFWKSPNHVSYYVLLYSLSWFFLYFIVYFIKTNT